MNKTLNHGNVSVGSYPHYSWTIQLQNRKTLTGYWNIPKEKELYWLCGENAFKALPLNWKGTCTLGAVVSNLTIIDTHPPGTWIRSVIKRVKWGYNPIAELNTAFHSFVR